MMLHRVKQSHMLVFQRLTWRIQVKEYVLAKMKFDLNNLNANSERNHVQDIRLINMERLDRDCDDKMQSIINAERTIQGTQYDFSSLVLITEDKFI